MKSVGLASVIVAAVVLIWGVFAPSRAQTPSQTDTPTFYHLVPGTYVNGWPRFTIHYPKDWVERHPRPDNLFIAGAPASTPVPRLDVVVIPWPRPLDKFAGSLVRIFGTIATDVTVVTDKASQLRDGSPAQEVELQMIVNGEPVNYLSLVTKKDDEAIHVGVVSKTGKIGEDLRAIPCSLELQPGFDEPVKVPPDVQAFLDEYRSANLSGDVAKIMTCYSDRYLEWGTTKGVTEQFWRQSVGSVASVEIGITDFLSEGDRAYLTGFALINGGKYPLPQTSIIKENGQWRWYGNQRDAAP